MQGMKEQALLQGGEGVDILNISHFHAHNPLKLPILEIGKNNESIETISQAINRHTEADSTVPSFH
jgi:hypothetical protein